MHHRRYTHRVWFLLISCVPVNLSSTESPVFYDADPVLEALDYTCDPTAGVWSFQFQTQGWTSGGRLYIARDSQTLEQHKVVSVEASADGAWDCLKEELSVAEDWTLAQSGSSSQWLCSESDSLSFMIQILDPRGESIADCAAWGSDLDVWNDVEDLEACTEFLQPEGQKTDTGVISWKGECDG